MPLRSVEAATRDDAIAAAREQFGPTARVVGVRRVRSGGVLGFFATERYVAEVADPAGRPVAAAPAPSRAPGAASDETPSDYSSPLASAAPARARAVAPARNGAAAWAAEAARSSLDQPAAPPRSAPAMARVPAAVPAEVRPAARTTAPARGGSYPAAGYADEERLSELAALLAAPPAAPEAPAPTRASFPRAELQRSPGPRPRDDGPRLLQEPGPGAGAAADAAPAAPSPFTAALARMVAGDQDVRQAVREALDDPAVPRARSDHEGSWPSRHEAPGPEDTSVASRATRQKEETVGDQVIAPSTSADQPVDVPAWATEPEMLAPAGSSREQAIAEVLRAALALGHSDEALAGILRKVLAGVAPQTALAEPELSVPVGAVPEVAVPPVTVPVPVVDPFPTPEPATPILFGRPAPDEVAPATTRVEPASAPIAAAPLFPVASPVPAALLPAAPLRTEPAPLFAAPASLGAPAPSFAAPAPFALPPLFAPSPGSMWGDPSPAPLWGDPVTVTVSRVRQPEALIWAEAAVGDDADADIATEVPAEVEVPAELEVPAEVDPDGSGSEDPAPMRDVVLDVYPEEPLVSDEPSAVHSPELDVHSPELDAQDVAVEEVHVAADEPEVDGAVDASVAELAPALARTASDPAPFMSLDSTTVMPPLSLLPPLPSSRGRGRPPVPPVSRPLSRDAPSTTLFPTAPAPSETAEESAETDVPVTAPATPEPPARSWATVTRLPVAPLTPEMPELDTDQAEEGADAFLADPASQLPGAGDVRGRLEALGLPADLLDDSFDDDVACQGTYAALTSALARRLPVAPALPAGAGEVLFVVGPGVETLRSARSLAATLRLDRDAVQWATRGELAGLAPKGSRMTTVETAIDRQQDAATSGSVTIVAVDAPLRTDSYWMTQMLAIWAPTAVWVVVEATRKPEDLEPWIDGLPRVDALVVTDADLSADPAAVLRRMTAPVAILDGVRATPHRWASLLCERLEKAKS